ncbi:hypothetical protein Tco_1540178 [Tanacetum coccineum]
MVRVSVLFRLWKTCLERASWTSEEVGMFIFCWLSFRIIIVIISCESVAPFDGLRMVESVSFAKFMWADGSEDSYADKRRKPLEFSVGDYVLLKVSPWKGVVRFRKKEKLAPRFVGPFEIITKKCLADPPLQVPLDEIQVDGKLNFVEELVEILEREFKKLKRNRIAIVKVRWNSKRGPEFTWEREDQMN